MLSGILGFILGAAGITGHWFFTKLRPGPSQATEMLPPEVPVTCAVENEIEITELAAAWKVRNVGDCLLTPAHNGYIAVIVHDTMENNFYNVRLMSDSSKYMNVHISLLFSKDEVDASKTSKN